MHVVAIHDIKDPAKFWDLAQSAEPPEGVTLVQTYPNPAGNRAICLWRADSVGTVKNVVESTMAGISENEFFEVNEANAMGLPSS